MKHGRIPRGILRNDEKGKERQMLKGTISKFAIVSLIVMIGVLGTQVALAAPAVTGQALDKVVIERTSKAEVISLFGPPQKTEAVGDQEVLYYQTMQQDPVTKANLCNVLTVTIGKNGKVDNLVYKRYCQ
jgi:hypothetical protein